jgi:hypothetical protein
MIGHPGRAVFGGPPTDGDAGITVIRVGNTYRITAGTLARVTRGASLAVYAEHPPSFPRLDSSEDRAARLGVVEVISAERATATATAIGAPFPVPPAARGRLIRAGANARLRCAVLPSDPGLEARLASSPLLELVAEPVRPEVRLEHRYGRWYVTDSVHGTGGSDGPVLFALQAAELDCARDVLEHYHAYSRPLHMAALAVDLAGSLKLRVRSCAQASTAASEAQTAALPEAPTRAESCYALLSGDPVCFEVHNGSHRRLRVTLLNSAGSGRVQQLGDEVIDAGHSHVFWANGALGVPFQMVPPRGSTRCIDRLVAIGRTVTAHDLGYLRVDRTFAQVIQRSRSGGRVLDDGSWDDRHGPEQWTAAQALIETSAR